MLDPVANIFVLGGRAARFINTVIAEKFHWLTPWRNIVIILVEFSEI